MLTTGAGITDIVGVNGVGGLFTAAMTMASTAGQFVISHPLVLTFVIVPLVGLGIGIFRRLLNL